MSPTRAKRPNPKRHPTKTTDEEKLDAALRETFPASDPIEVLEPGSKVDDSSKN